MKTNFDKIMQTNRIIKLTQSKSVRLYNKKDIQGMCHLVNLINDILILKNELDPTRKGEKYNNFITLDKMMKHIEVNGFM